MYTEEQIETIRRRLKDRRLYVVARETGLSYQGILNFLTGAVRRPKSKTIDKLREYLDANK